jgi:ATP-dependent DNA helicase RecG
LEAIPNKIREHLGIITEVNLHQENGAHYLEIVVPPYTVPVSLRGRYYYRTGSNKLELTGNALNEFLLKNRVKLGTMSLKLLQILTILIPKV